MRLPLIRTTAEDTLKERLAVVPESGGGNMLSTLMLWANPGAPGAFQIYGRGKPEPNWRVIHVLATARRNCDSRWPFFGGACICWSPRVIAVGWDFAECVLREQMVWPASRDQPVRVGGGRLRHRGRRGHAAVPSIPLASEILAHECGHSCQARRFGPLYLPIGAVFTWWREGLHWWNWFENEASEIGEFGGIISGSVHPRLWSAVQPGSSALGDVHDLQPDSE